MPRRPGESAADWYERAIVTNSLASGALEDLDLDPEPVSQVTRRTVAKTAKAAASDLSNALDAYIAERASGPKI